jgi:hypothetical protein
LLAFFGIGWSVSRRQPWLEYRVGRERFWRWYQSYATTAARFFPVIATVTGSAMDWSFSLGRTE